MKENISVKKYQQSVALDVCKGIAILMIIIVHNRHFVLTNMDGMRQLINYGQMGCQLFFVISGFALCHSWEHFTTASLEKSSMGMSPFQHYTSFMKKRIVRIWPGFAFMIIVNLILNIILDDMLHISPGFIIKRKPLALLLNFLLLHGFSPKYINNVAPGGWYIGTTMILYALFPLLYWIFKKIHQLQKYLIVVLPIALWIGCYAILKQCATLNDGVFYPSNNSFAYFSFVNQLPCFSLGILLFFQEKHAFSKKCPLLLSAGAFIAVLLYSIHLYMQPDNTENFLFVLVPFVAGLAFYWMIAFALHIEKSLPEHQPKPVSYPFAFLAECGKSSYGIYLVHGLFSWYLLKALSTYLIDHEIMYNDMVLYFVVYVPTVLLAYFTGKGLQALLNHFTGKKTAS